MEEQNQVDLNTSLRSLVNRGKAIPSEDSPLGSIRGNSLLVDGLDVPIPLSDVLILRHWQDSRNTFARPNYKNGDRVLLIKRADSDYVIAGRV